MAATRRCPGTTRPDGTPGPCPHLIPPGTRYCPTHMRDYETHRGTSTQRGYDATHRATRTHWVAHLQAGHPINCWRCGKQILTATDMHIGHDDHDRTITRGPEHALCNLQAAGRSAHR